MLFYLALCVLVIIIYLLTRLGKRDKKTKDRLFLVITFIVLFVVVASREMTVGSDTSTYLDLFKKSSIYKWDIINMKSYFETGYLTFNVLLSYLNVTPRLFLCIMAFVCCFAIYKFIKDNSNNYLRYCTS